MTTKTIATHLATAQERNDGIACEGWYYPKGHEHRTSNDFNSVTCPVCIDEVMFWTSEAAKKIAVAV